MSDAVITAEAIENGDSPYSVNISVSGHSLRGDEPVSFGGGNTGPSPYDFLTAALAECTAMTVRWYAKQKNWPLERVEAVVTHRKVDIEGSGKKDVFEKHITLQAPDLTQEQKQKLIEVSARCPVQRTLEGASEIRMV